MAAPSTPIPATPATRMRIATMYTGAGAMDYGYARRRRRETTTKTTKREREKAHVANQPPLRRATDDDGRARRRTRKGKGRAMRARETFELGFRARVRGGRAVDARGGRAVGSVNRVPNALDDDDRDAKGV